MGMETFRPEKPEAKLETVWEKIEELEAIESPTDTMTSVAFFPAGKVAAGVEGSTIRTWLAGTGEELRKFEAPAEVSSLTATPDSNIAYGSKDSRIRILDPRTGQQTKEIVAFTKEVSALTFTRDGNMVYGGQDGLVGFIDTQSGGELRHFETKTGGVAALVERGDGKLAVGGLDGSVRVLDPRTGKEFWRADAESRRRVSALAIGPEGTVLAGTEDGLIRVLDKTGKEIKQLAGHTDAVSALVYDWENKRVKSASKDGTMRTWGTK